MSTRLVTEVSVRIDESALSVFDAIGRDKFKILVTVGSTFYEICCGVYYERNLDIKMVEKIDDSSDLVRLEGDTSLYINKEALEFVKSRGNHFAIYADSKRGLYSDQWGLDRHCIKLCNVWEFFHVLPTWPKILEAFWSVYKKGGFTALTKPRVWPIFGSPEGLANQNFDKLPEDIVSERCVSATPIAR